MSGDGFTTCLWFDGQAKEAAEYYVSVFKDGRIGRTAFVPEGGMGEPGTVLTVEFEINGQKFVGLNGGPVFTFSEAISFQVPCADQDEADYYWDRLIEGGGEPSQCGWLKDRFGVSWQVFPAALIDLTTDPDPAKARRATEAMLTMSKIDIAAIEKAHAGN